MAEKDKKQVDYSNMPSNSNKKKTEADPEAPSKRKSEPLTQGVVRKKNWFHRAVELFAGDDVGNVRNFIVVDIVIPAIKNMISEAVSGGIEQFLFGTSDRRSGRRDYSSSYARARGSSITSVRDNGRDVSRRGRATHDFKEIVIPSRAEADEILDKLMDYIERYDCATVKDLLELCDVPPNFADEKWGWFNLSGATIRRVSDGYLLVLPRTEPID